MQILITLFFYQSTKLFVSAVTLSARDNHNYQNFAATDVKEPSTGINTKQKVKIKIQQTTIYIFLNQTFSKS